VGLVCLLTAGGSMTTTDAVIAYDVTKGLVERGSVALSEESPHYEAYRGRDGRYYSPFGIAQSVWNIPFYLCGRAGAAAIGGSLGTGDTIPKAAVALGTVPAVALLAWVGFALLLKLGADPPRAAVATLALVFGTSLWPYSGFGFNQPLTALFLWGAILAAVSGGSTGALAACGALAGLAVLTRHEMLGAAALIGGWVALRHRGTPGAALLGYATGLAPMLAIWAGLNWWRFGNPLESGYLRDTTPGLGSSPLVGVSGLLFSPYASIFLYSPIVILSAWGWRALWRRDRSVAGFLIVLVLAYLALYGSLSNWMGGRSYGPRYLVPLLPALVLPLTFWTPGRRARRAAVAIAIVSVTVQLPGVLVDYSKVRMERASAGETVAQDMRWRGMPLLLNAREVATNGAHAVRFLAGREGPPPIDGRAGSLSTALSSSLDLWWLSLAMAGAIGRAAALGLAIFIGAAGAFSLRRALALARESRIEPAS
jgi:hypothetical protein